MENWTDFNSNSLIDKITFYLTGNARKNPVVIKLNSEKLVINGELHFLNSINAWRNYVVCNSNCASILQHFAHTRGVEGSPTDTDKEILDKLISESSRWSVKIQQCMLQKEKVCLFLNRTSTISNAIKMAIECNITFGRIATSNKTFDLKYQPDVQSDLTTKRLCLMRNVARKLLDLQGYRISDENCLSKYIFTTKSEGPVDEGYEKYICGVVKNSQSNMKETCLTWEQCIKHRINQLATMNKHELFKNDENDVKKNVFLYTIANAILTFELMTMKPSRSIIIEIDNLETNRNVTSTKGASFVLYNTARIASIIAKYNEMVLQGNLLRLPNIENVDFSQLHEEEEWELVYNFIFGYPQMLKNCLKYEPTFQICPQMICLFLSRLCQKFSAYYRRIRILTEQSEHLTSKMLARLYMLHALQVVLQNALDILDIKPMSRM